MKRARKHLRGFSVTAGVILSLVLHTLSAQGQATCTSFSNAGEIKTNGSNIYGKVLDEDHYLRIGDDDEPENQQFEVTFLPPKEEVFKTVKYRVSVAGIQRLEEFPSDPTALRISKSVRFTPFLEDGKYIMNVRAFSETGASSEDSNDMNFLVEPDPLTEQDRTITATGLDAQGTPVPDAVKKVYWDESTKTVYYNPNNNTVKKVRVTVGVPESKTPWKVDFGARGTNPSEGNRWGHFEDYEVFKPTPTP